jgi:solute carrier family 35, member E3
MLENLETFSQSIKASLMVLLLGVGIASVTDLQLNLLGSVIAVLTIAATCVGQIVSFYFCCPLTLT